MVSIKCLGVTVELSEAEHTALMDKPVGSVRLFALAHLAAAKEKNESCSRHEAVELRDSIEEYRPPRGRKLFELPRGEASALYAAPSAGAVRSSAETRRAHRLYKITAMSWDDIKKSTCVLQELLPLLCGQAQHLNRAESITVWMFASMLARTFVKLCPRAPKTSEELNNFVRGTTFSSNSKHPVVLTALCILKLDNPFAGPQSGFLSSAWLVRQHLPYKVNAAGTDADHLIKMFAGLMDAAASVSDGLRYIYLLSQNRLPVFYERLLRLCGGSLMVLGNDVAAVNELVDILVRHKVPLTNPADVHASNRNAHSLTWGLKSNAKAFDEMSEVQDWRGLLQVCAKVPVIKAGFSRSHFAAGVVMSGALQHKYPMWKAKCKIILSRELFGRDMEEADFAGCGNNVIEFFACFGITGLKEITRFYTQWYNETRRALKDVVIDVDFSENICGDQNNESGMEQQRAIALADFLSFENPQSQICMAVKKVQRLLGCCAAKNIRAQHLFQD